MSEFCLNCNKPLPKGVQSSFCSRTCWSAYKDRRGIGINPERQATIMLKDTSKSLISSLKEEIDKKDDIIQHQDKLVHDYRESLEAREREIAKFQTKIKYLENLNIELKQQITDLSKTKFEVSEAAVQEKASFTKKSFHTEPAIAKVDPNYNFVEIEVVSEGQPSKSTSSVKSFRAFWERFVFWKK